MIGNKQKHLLIWLRNYQMELMKICLKFYKQTKKEEFIKFAKEFGQTSNRIKKELKQHD